MAFPPGTRHTFRFTKPDGSDVVLDATVVHCRLASAGTDGQVTFITGFEFISDETSDGAIEGLIDTIASVLAGE